MRTRSLAISMGAALVAMELLALPALAAPPVCGRKACREEIKACVESECSGLSGKERAHCKKGCVRDVQSDCNANSAVCNPTATTSPPTTTPPTTSTPTTGTPTTTPPTTLPGSPSGGYVD